MGSRLESNSDRVRKRIEGHTFQDEEGEEYGGSKFGGFPEYFRRKKIKLQNLDAELRSNTANNPPIFRGIVANVNGYTQPSLNDLHRLIVSYGGGFMQYLDGKTTVTHIIAASLTPKKVVEFKRYRVVKPAWIVDSINAGHLLPWDAYRVIDEGTGQKVLGFDNGQIVSQVNNKPRGYRDQTDNSWYTSQLADLYATSSTQLPTPDDSSLPEDEEGKAALEEPDVAEVEDQLERDIDGGVSVTGAGEGEPDGFVRDNERLSVIDPILPNDPSQVGSPDLPDELRAIDGEQRQLRTISSPQGTKRKETSPVTSPDSKKHKFTAEEHNAQLLSDPRIRKSSTLNPDFLEQYYRESRLHHLSAWKAELKSQLQAMTAAKSASQQIRQKRPPGARRYILHVDFDSFFVAVSLKKCPQYAELPACVAHGGGSGSEIASCNYPARTFGVKNGMWMKHAQVLCKDLKVLPYDFPAYEEASRLFYEAILATGGIVQSVSVDEALIDVSSLCLTAGGSDGVGIREGSIYREQAKADEIGQGLRDTVKKQTGCAVSVGIGGNILLAKVALRKAKPAGQHQIMPEDALDFLAPLQVQDLPGVASSIGGRLEEVGVKSVSDLRDCTKEKLINVLGPKTGEKLYCYARGIDKTEVGDQVVRKSVSAEVNWGVRFETQEQAEEFVENLCGELNKRLLKERVKGKQLTMKIMRRAADAPLDPPKHLGHGKCDTFNKSIVLGVATNSKEMLAKEALSILRGYGFSPGELRGLGVQMTKLEPIKSTTDGETTSSQKRLHFKTSLPANVPDEEHDDPIQDDHETPKKLQSIRTGPACPLGVEQTGDSPSRKPLNILGTQFIMPTQVDPQVLAELPPDIRSRLAKLVRPTPPTTRNPIPEVGEAVPKPSLPISAIPNQSQLDPDALDALPEDLRAEILAHYATSPTKQRAGQSVLPQSPRKNRTLPAPRRGASRGRGRGGSSLLSRMKASSKFSNISTLTQSNFVATTRAASIDRIAADSDGGGHTSDAEIAPEFLAALPEDLRQEVIAQHRADQLKKNAGLQVAARKRTVKPQQQDPNVVGTGSRERMLSLPSRPPRPSFTTNKLWRVGDLRDAVSEWYDAFSKEGPYKEDVEALARYLESVVTEEGDMGKAKEVVRWMEWVIEGSVVDVEQGVRGEAKSKGRDRWERALERTRLSVRDAVFARGLGDVDL